jgi:hypothetical protein
MSTKFLTLVFVIGFATVCVLQAQSPTPAGSPAESPSPAKHRTHKKTPATSSPTENAESPSTTESPAASPVKKHARKKEAAAAAAETPTSSPAKSSLADFFKPRTSGTATPAVARKGVTGATPTAIPAAGGGNGKVWVNTETHVYHKEGSRFYGKTKRGKYVTEEEAIKEGDRAAAKGE